MACLQFGVPFKTVATNNTPSTVAAIKCPTNQAVKALGIFIGCDGTNSAQGPAIMEVGHVTFATNGPGTNSTTVTPAARDDGRPETIQSTAGKAWSAEPTVWTVTETFNVPVYMGSSIMFYPLTAPLVAKGGSGWGIRVTQQSGISANVSGALLAEE